jgi:Flp pilus assembly protein CpaB
MIAAALAAFVLVVSVLQDRSLTAQIVVADVEILPGTAITPDMVSVVEIPADSDLVDRVATMADLADHDVSAGHRLAEGDPITLTALAPASTPSGLRAMSLPIDRVDAVGGDLAAGDRVDIISVSGGSAAYIAVDLEVIATQSSDGRTGSLSSTAALSTYYVTVSIDDQAALAVALAMDVGEVAVLRSTGAEPVPIDERQLRISGLTASDTTEPTAQTTEPTPQTTDPAADPAADPPEETTDVPPEEGGDGG